jgi:hypothetical protein
VGERGFKACPELAEGYRKRGPPTLKINQHGEVALAKRIGLFASTDDDARADRRTLADISGLIRFQ